MFPWRGGGNPHCRSERQTQSQLHEIKMFKTDLEALRNQLNDVVLRTTSNSDVLEELRVSGDDMQNGHVSLQSFLESNTACLQGVNRTLASYSGMIDDLQTDTARLQSEIQGQATEQSQTQVRVDTLNITQTQQRGLLSALHQTVEDVGQAVQRLKNDYQVLQQTARQMRTDTEWLKEKVQNLQVLAANNSALAKTNGDALDDLGVQLSTLASQIQNASAVSEGHDQSLRELMDRQRDHDNATSLRFDEMEARLDSQESDLDQVTGNVSVAAQILGVISSDLNGLRSCAETVLRHSDLLLVLNATVLEAREDGGRLSAQQDRLEARLDREVGSLAAMMEELKLVDSRHSQLITNFTILRGKTARLASLCPRPRQGSTGTSGERLTGTGGTQGRERCCWTSGGRWAKRHSWTPRSIWNPWREGRARRAGASRSRWTARDARTNRTSGPQGSAGPCRVRGASGACGPHWAPWSSRSARAAGPGVPAGPDPRRSHPGPR
uniref:Collectin sub-family member 12 n=1 Tax=Salarias fasciatus TaxID=181472 RepID=A0A672HXE8_SALFA